MNDELAGDNRSLDRDGGFVVFAGAGVSMVAPASLPNWWAFNETVVGALTKRLAVYTRESLGDSAFRTLISRRDGSTTFAPDYMADIVAEECGFDYFRVLQALDTGEFNACHAIIADLAGAGRCKAVVTTNFDRLFERAFEARGVLYETFYSPEHFERLSESLAGDGPVPIIKVHGSAEAPETMVDTLSQRLVGRPKPLEDALQQLYARHHLVILGFSGADLDYDPNYLGLREAGGDNRGFTYLALSLARVKPAIVELAEAWGHDAKIVEGRLPQWLVQFAREVEVQVGELPDDSAEIDRLPDVAAAADDWAESLGDLQATNILASLLRASGDDPQAGYVFYQVWRHYRRSQDAQDPSYGRFQYHLGRFLLEYGWTIDTLRPKLSRVIKMGSDDLDRDKLDNAFQFLARAYKQYEYGIAMADLAVCYALMGNVKAASNSIFRLLDAAVEIKHPPMFIDGAAAGGTVWSIGGVWTDGLKRLEIARDLAAEFGWENRRARILAHLVRFLAWKERHDEAEHAYRESRKIVERLGMEGTRLRLESAWGYALYEQRRYKEGVDVLLPVCDELERTGRLADLTRAALDLFDVAYGLWEQEPLERASALLDEHEVGYRPHVHLAYAEAFLRSGQLDEARAEVEQARTMGQETKNEWAVETAASLEEAIQKRAGA